MDNPTHPTPKPILVVEDDADFRGLLQDALEDRGYTVHCVADGQQALEFLQSEQPCAVLLDLKMPTMGGNELYGVLKTNPDFSYIPIIISTGLSLEAPGGAMLLRKPYRLEQLLQLLEEYCGAA